MAIQRAAALAVLSNPLVRRARATKPVARAGNIPNQLRVSHDSMDGSPGTLAGARQCQRGDIIDTQITRRACYAGFHQPQPATFPSVITQENSRLRFNAIC